MTPPKLRRVAEDSAMQCPSPDQGPIAMILWRIGQLENRIVDLDEQFDTLIATLNKQAGAWVVMKMVGAFLVGAAVVVPVIFSLMRLT